MRSQLTWLVLVLAGVGVGLYAIGAAPRLPSSADAGNVSTLLRGSDLPTSTIGYVIADAAWLVWAWLVLSLVLRVAVDVADGASRGARWVASLRVVSDAITLPIVRRAVDGALAAVLVANVAMRSVPTAAAEPLATAPNPAAVVTTVQSPSESPVPRARPRPADATHVVRPGETLWSIAEQYYGSGQDYQRLVDANVGQPMGKGQVFTRAGVIQPGWSLRVPRASATIENVDGTYWYTVESGDTLWGISGRLLGDETRWPELFDANRGAQLDEGHVLQDPNLIWPNLRLKLPPPIVGVELDAEAVPDAAAPVTPVAPPAPAPVPAAPVAPMPAEHATFNAFAVGGGPAAAVAVAAAAGAALIARKRGRRDLLELPLSGDPQTDVPIRGGFAEVDPSREAAQPATFLAAHVQQVTTRPMRLAMLKFGCTRSSAVLEGPPEARSGARAAAASLATRLGRPIDVRVSRDQDAVLEMAMPGGEVPAGSRATTLVPLCVLTDRRELWVEPRLGGHVLVASLPGAGADVVLTSLVAALAARRTPGQLKIWTIASPNQLPAVLDGLPHQVKPRADSRNRMEADSAMRDVRAELIRRMQRPESEVPPDEPQIVLALGELAEIDYSSHKTTLDILGTYGPAHGVRMLAATRDSARTADELLGHFGTRLVLRTATAEESRRLLGQTDAVDLLGGGQLWARVGMRQPLEGYGVRIRPDVLERFVRLQRSRHGLGPLAPPLQEVAAEPTAPPHLVDLNVLDAEPIAALIHVRCFGGFDVHGPTGELVPSLDELSADSAWDVLAILASAPEGAVATAELQQRLWPDAPDPEAALRTTLASLRRMLVRALPELEGDAVRFADDGATCHLDTRQVISDVHRFLRLCRAAPHMAPDQARLAWQRARALYRGALLDGPGARAWPWAAQPDAESGGLSLRERYREQAYAATRGLARLAAFEGRTEDAVVLYRELLGVEPTLEDIVRELCECYEQLGDFAAIREEEVRLNRALQAAYADAAPEDDPLAYEPDASTVAIFDRARAALAEHHTPTAAVVAD